MALARIITRSQSCSRELALDLLARGYTVEIVSPDQIPDNLADLELRVDTEAVDHLVASVETHDGDRSASLDFVHHLKSPMGDFIRRPVGSVGAVHVPVNFNAEPNFAEMEGLAQVPEMSTPPAVLARADFKPDASIAAREAIVIPLLAADVPIGPSAKPVADLQLAVPAEPKIESAKKPVLAEPTSVPPKSANPPIVAAKTAPPISVPLSSVQRKIPRRSANLFFSGLAERDRSALWSSAVTFACVLLLALILWFGMRQTSKVNASREPSASHPASPQAVQATNEAKTSVTSKDIKAGLSTGVPTAAIGASPKPEIPVARPLTTANKTTLPHHRDDGYIARDTVVYLDRKVVARTPVAAKTPKRPSTARKRTTRNTRDGVIAANTVTYLDGTAAPKTAKRDHAQQSNSIPK